MRALPQALEIIFEVQKRRSNEKTARKKKSFSTYKMQFFFFSLDPFLFSKLLTFSFIVHLKTFKVL
jgi:hypothetical protein